MFPQSRITSGIARARARLASPGLPFSRIFRHSSFFGLSRTLLALLCGSAVRNAWAVNLESIELSSAAEVWLSLVALSLAAVVLALLFSRRRLIASERELHARDERLRLALRVFEAANEGVLITDHKARIVEVNPAFCRITGYSREEVLGNNPNMLSSGRHGPSFYREMWAKIGEVGFWRGEIWNRRKNGDEYPEHLSINAVRGPDGAVTHYVALLSDISHLKAHEQELKRMAHYDPLTGLPNRRLLSDRIEQGMAQTRRSGAYMALAVLDLDGFKPINDNLGHEAGDMVLKGVAQRLRATLRGGDTAARLGGDEFVLVLQGVAGRSACESTMARILEELAKPLELEDGHDVSVSASIGVTLFPDDDADADTLLRHADQAMYLAKQAGRNRYHIFDIVHDREAQELREELESLSIALQNGEFVLYYQPKVDMQSGDVLGVEALVRWQHPVKGLMSPASFLPLLANTEHELMFGDWVLRTALAQQQSWFEKGIALPVSVNASVRYLVRPELVQYLAELLRMYPHAANIGVEVEILEGAAVDDWESMRNVLNQCREMGVSFALDDFGTGYSTLLQLRRLSTQTLKIDQHFVRDMLDDADDRTIVESVIRLSESFQRQVVAEGVETEAHARVLLELGCRIGQGYGIGRPMPAAALERWLVDWQAAGFWRHVPSRVPQSVKVLHANAA